MRVGVDKTVEVAVGVGTTDDVHVAVAVLVTVRVGVVVEVGSGVTVGVARASSPPSQPIAKIVTTITPPIRHRSRSTTSGVYHEKDTVL